jgi:hypothetical protein
MQYVWVHVHEGTLILAWKFETLEAAQDFREKYGSDSNDEREWEDIPYLPGGSWKDDPDSDTWVLIEGNDIDIVDGDKVEPFVEP